jgi:predicted transcriptional regulator
MAITATSLKIPTTLKAELDKLARHSGQTTHAVMVRALTEHVAAANRYRVFLNDAARADAAMLESGVGYAAQDVRSYVLAKARGEKAKRPRPVKWRK